MTTAVIGATGRVGSELVRGVVTRGDAVAALVRDPDKARRVFGEPDGLRIRSTRLADPRDLAEAFDGIGTVFIAMGCERLIDAGVPAGTAELLITREWADPRRRERLRPTPSSRSPAALHTRWPKSFTTTERNSSKCPPRR